GIGLAALRDVDLLEPLVRLDVLRIEREDAAQVIGGLLVQAVLHVNIGLGEDLRDLLGVALARRRDLPRIRRRLHCRREVGVLVLGRREVAAGQALLVEQRHRAGHRRGRRLERRQVAGGDAELRVGGPLAHRRGDRRRRARRRRGRRRRARRRRGGGRR